VSRSDIIIITIISITTVSDWLRAGRSGF